MVYSVILLNFNTAFKYKMNIKKYFDYTPSFDLTAAHIAINRWDWVTIDTEDEEKAKNIMKMNRFDVLPFKNQNGDIESYYSTRTWNNFETLNFDRIDHADTIYYRLSFTDLIRKFNEENRHFYFLTNHKDILGLVSYVNLSSQPVYSYLFQLISDLEMKIARLLEEILSQEDVINEFRSSDYQHLIDILSTFDKAATEGKDNSIFQYMYLQTLGITLDKFRESLPSEMKPLLAYRNKFAGNGLFTNVRNTVMHPVNPVLSERVSINDLNEFLEDYLSIMDVISLYN